MPVPIYQTPAHLANEARVAAEFSSWLGSMGTKLPMFDPADRVFLFGQLYAEIKCRDNPRTAYKTYSVSAKKKIRAEQRRRPTVLVIEWLDGLGVLSVHKPCFYKMGGRFDRPNDPNAIERMAHYAIDRFRMIR